MNELTIDWVARARDARFEIRDLVAGRRHAPSGSERLVKYSPRDGEALYEFGAGKASEVDRAVSAARSAFDDRRWSGLTVERRKEVLYRLASLIETHREELALLECLDVGKPIRDAYEFDVPAAASAIRYSAESADKLNARVYGADASSLTYQLRKPVGVVGGIIGWNFPLVLAVQKIGPVLATGNTLVLKPSELTSLSAARVAELALEAGVPEGVLNVVHGGPSMGAALARHGDVDLLTFTGSSSTGKKLLIAAGESNMKRLVLECGGKAPNIVFEDAPELSAVAAAIIGRAFWNQGQVCTASSRLLLEESVKPKLLPLLIEKCEALGLGDPLDPNTRFAAVVSGGHRDKVRGFMEAGAREGSSIAYRSKAPLPFPNGFYVPPLIFDEVAVEHRIAQEEIFGPVLSILTFRNEYEAIRVANSTIYGLSAIVWTRDVGRAHRMCQGIRAGWIVVNATGTPVGGADAAMSVGGHKQSGIGTEGGLEGLEAYTTSSAVQLFV